MKKMLVFRLVIWSAFGVAWSNASWDLYLDPSETHSLIGVSSHLYYVRNGAVLKNAGRYKLSVAPNATKSHFVWVNSGPPNQTHEVKYNITFTVDKESGLQAPSLNITRYGTVSRSQPEIFAVELQCTGTAPFVHVTLHLAITIGESNTALVEIHRVKLCTDGDYEIPYPPITPHADPAGNISVTDTVSDTVSKAEHEWPTSTDLFYIAIGVAVAIIMTIAAGATIFYMRTKRKHLFDSNGRTSNADEDVHSDRVFAGTNETSFTENGADQPLTGPAEVEQPMPPATLVDVGTGSLSSSVAGSGGMAADGPLQSICVGRSNVTVCELLLEGTFGRIYAGTAFLKSDAMEYQEQHVYIKTVTDDASTRQVKVLITEGTLLVGLKHANINPLLAICCAAPSSASPPLLLYASSSKDKGNLKIFLQSCIGTALCLPFSVHQTVCMAIQVAEALSYLHQKKIVHRDVAARNCTVDSDLTVRVTDYALARDCFPGDYHCLGDNENRPVKWMPLEALVEKKFSPAADVWSYGVLLWELVTYAQQPYADLDPSEMAAYLAAGYRCQQPSNCPDELYAIMACCWTKTPAERPKLSKITECLGVFREMLDRYV